MNLLEYTRYLADFSIVSGLSDTTHFRNCPFASSISLSIIIIIIIMSDLGLHPQAHLMVDFAYFVVRFSFSHF